MKSQNTSAHLSILAANILFGVNYAVSKYLVPAYMSPLATTTARVLFACLMFWLIAGMGNYEKVDKKDMWRLFFCGLTGVLLNMYLFLKGISYTSPVDSSIIMTLTPLLVLLISAIVVKESITKNKVFGIILGAAGAIILIVVSGVKNTAAPNQMLGNIISFGSSLSYSIYLVIAKPLMEKYRPLTVMRWVFTFACLMMLPLGGKALTSTDFNAFDLNGTLSFLFVLIGATFLTYLGIAYGLRKVRSTTVSIYNYLQPVVASLLAIALGFDKISVITIVCAVLVFSGVYLVTKSK